MDDKTIEACARVAHEANRALCIAQGDLSQKPFDHADQWQRDSAISGVKHALAGATPEQQHAAWMRHKIENGWTLGAEKDAVAKTHPCIVPYSQLPASQRAKDALFGAVVRAMAQAITESAVI